MAKHVKGSTKSAARLFTRVDAVHALNTSNFTASADCIGCGICERACLASAIEVRDGRPQWVKDRCFMCFGCLRLCPTVAIRYGVQ
jgi:formate hydrogenlyase subunit 6/NADH:ubiquinone oxidoreductase subunit I